MNRVQAVACPLTLLATLLSSGRATEPTITALAVAPEGNAVVAGSQAGLVVRSWPALEQRRTLATTMAHVHDLAFSPRGDVLAVVGGFPAESGAVELFDWPSGALRVRDASHDDEVHAIAWRGDSGAWATASLDRTAQIHDAGGNLLRIVEGHSGGVLALCYMPEGRTLVTGGLDQSVRVWNAESGASLRRLDNHTGAVRGLALRPRPLPEALPMIASIGDDRTVRFWQPTIGRMVRLTRLESVPLALAWLEDGRAVAVGSADGHVRMVDPESAAVLRDLPALDGRVSSLAVAPGNAIVVGGEDGRLRRLSLVSRPPIP